MKKIIIIFLLLFLTSCKNIDTISEEKILDININTWVDKNPIKIGIYNNNKLVKDYTTTLDNFKDIAIFNIYYTNEEELPNENTSYLWNKYYQNYQFIDNYKIGFIISFYVKDKLYKNTILNPNQTFDQTPYLYNYLYDDIHQLDNSWYSHLEEKDINDQTVYSSIKLFLAQNGKEITSPITLTVFTYDEDDFDSLNNYIGNSYYTININIK